MTTYLIIKKTISVCVILLYVMAWYYFVKKYTFNTENKEVEIKPKFDIDDTVYRLILKDFKTQNVIKWIVCKVIITRKYIVSAGFIYFLIDYDLIEDGDLESNIFATEVEAQTECNKRNGELYENR